MEKMMNVWKMIEIILVALQLLFTLSVNNEMYCNFTLSNPGLTSAHLKIEKNE